MADLVAADVTITIDERWIHNKKRYSEIQIAFGDASDTYPAGGVPMPAYSSFGMIRNLEDILLSDAASGDGLVYKYDKTNNKIRIYEGNYADTGDGPLVELDSGSDAPAAAVLKGVCRGW